MKEKVKVGYVGYGRRGKDMFTKVFGIMNDVEVVAICDLQEDRMIACADFYESQGHARPKLIYDYSEMVNDPEIDAIILMTGWKGRIPLAIESLKAGKYTAIEVGCAYTLEECYDLLKAYETHHAPLMMLENCCYGRREMAALKLVREGKFGEVCYCAGAYHHYLPNCDLLVKKDGKLDRNHYRLPEYVDRNCEQYPTHELGPIAKLLNINRGNRIVSLSSFSSKARGLKDYIEHHLPDEKDSLPNEYAQGDIISTNMYTSNGELIHLTLDTTLPRPYYNREFTIRGTRGMCAEVIGDTGTFFLDDEMEEGKVRFNETEFLETHDHPLYEEYNKLSARGSHGGIDWLVGRAFIDAVKYGTDTPIDIYDSLMMLAIAPLSAESIKNGGAPVEFPDFTNGKWMFREHAPESKYSLDLVVSKPEIPIIP